jgi:hypothetical protein
MAELSEPTLTLCANLTNKLLRHRVRVATGPPLYISMAYQAISPPPESCFQLLREIGPNPGERKRHPALREMGQYVANRQYG